MPRQARQKSKSGVYHVILRGINQQIIFEEEEDYERFIKTLKAYRETCGYKLFAYCLMGNHLHLLIKVENEDLGTIVKRIAGSYVYWYNWKYSRSGYLFQGRFKSEAVENDGYFLTVLRYIHRNPVESGLCKNIEAYKFCSFNDYLKGESELIDLTFVFSLVDKREFKEYHQEKCDYEGLDTERSKARLRDADAMSIIEKVSKCKSASDFQLIEPDRRKGIIRKLREGGLSIRQIKELIVSKQNS